MSENAKAHPLSCYLIYCIALRLSDDNLGKVNSDGISGFKLTPVAHDTICTFGALKDESDQFLFACVSETLQHGNRMQGAKALQAILARYNDNLPYEINLAALLRCVTGQTFMHDVCSPELGVLFGCWSLSSRRNLVMQKRSYYGSARSLGWVSSACHISTSCGLRLIIAATKLQVPDKGPSNGPDNGGHQKLNPPEIEWLSKNAFNLALTNRTRWPTTTVIEMLNHSATVCITD